MNSSKFDLLWSNPNLSTKFTAQTIYVDTNMYSVYIVVTKMSEKSEFYSNLIMNIKDLTQMLTTIATTNPKRTCTVTDDGLVFGVGQYAGSSSYSTENAHCIPAYIYGIK